MIQISIVIPVYNRKEDVVRCLGSIDSMRTDAYEVVVVDDASTDGSYEVAKREARPNMKFYRNVKNSGVNYTRNRGIEKAKGRYVLFLDSDDALFPGGLDKVISFVEAQNSVSHFLFLVSGEAQPASEGPIYHTTYEDWITEKVFGDFTHVIRREVLLQYPFFEEFRAYEGLNWMRILRATSPQTVVPQTVTWVDLQRSDNLTKTLKLRTKEAISGKFEFLKRYFELYGQDIFRLDPVLYARKFRHALMLGVAAGRKKEAVAMLNASPAQNKLLYRPLVTLIPASLMQKLITAKANM